MDTSEQYIKMCDCPEIQDGWRPNKGDFYAWTPHGGKEYSTISMMLRCSCHVSIEKDIENFVWLPQQDQLQEMVFTDPIFHGDVVGNIARFDIWCRQNWIWGSNAHPKNEVFTSMEQLWLAFVMWELHKKKWTGEKWEE